MAIDKLVPRHLNFEDDERLVKRVEMIDAQNVRIQADDDGDEGVIKNVEGNTVVSFKTGSSLPSGTNKVIGSVHNNVKAEILFFVWNSAQKHRIYRYGDSNEEVETVFENEATGVAAGASADTLGFKSTDYVDATAMVDKDGDTLLYFTNGRGEPKKINVDRAIRGDYPTGYEAVEAYISLIKKPPLEPPTFELNSNPLISENRLVDKQFQFACQYVYEDGEVSAISPYSKISKSLIQTQSTELSAEIINSIENEITITCPVINSDVKKVRFLSKEGNDGVFFNIGEESVSNINTEISIVFSNEKAYSPVSTQETNKLFDAVPIDAKSISISGNRLFIANYKEGFENLETSGSLKTNYHKEQELKNANLPSDATSDISSGFVNGLHYSKKNTSGSEPNYLQHQVHVEFDDFDDALFSNKNNLFFNLRVSWEAVQLNVGITGSRTRGGSINVPAFSSTLHTSSPLEINISLVNQNITSKTDLINILVNEINSLQAIEVSTLGTISSTTFNGVLFLDAFASNLSSKLVIDFLPTKVRLYSDGNGFIDTFSVSANQNRNIPSDPSFTLGESKVSVPTSLINQNFIFLQKGNATLNSFVDFGDTSSLTSFKAGATHQIGVVYQDNNGRLSTVYPVGETNSDWYDSPARFSNKGRSSVVMRLNHNPPENAQRYFPVYAGNTTVGNFLQYTVNQAFKPTNVDSNTVPDTDDSEEKIYVSMRGFEGKENSYVENFSPKISYSFAEGDVAKIISVNGDKEYSQEFEVLGYESLGADTNNPILSSTLISGTTATTATAIVERFERTGFFLVLRKQKGENLFTEATGTTDLTQWANKCVIEIRSKKVVSDNPVYFQLGDSFTCTGNTHQGQRTATSATGCTLDIGVDLQQSTGATNDAFGTLSSPIKLFAGDEIDINTGSDVLRAKVHNVTESSSSSFLCVISLPSAVLSTSFTLSIVSISVPSFISNQPVIQIYSGDVYYRKRRLIHGIREGVKNRIISFTSYIEDYRINDFVDASNDYGKPNAFAPDADVVSRNSSITYSDAHVMDSDRLSLSSFNNSLANFLDIKNKYGAVQRLVDIEDAFYAVQEHKVTLFPVNRNVIQTAGGDASVTLSTDVVNLNSSKSFAGEYGCGDAPESVVYYNGVLYFVDKNSNKVFSISSSGISEISNIFADSFISGKLDALDKAGNHRVYSGIDPDNEEYLLSAGGAQTKTIKVDNDSGKVHDIPSLSVSGLTDLVPRSTNQTPFGKFALVNFNFNSIDATFSDLGNGVFYVDDAFAPNALQMDTDSVSTGTTNIVYTDKANSFLGLARVNNTNKNVELDPS